MVDSVLFRSEEFASSYITSQCIIYNLTLCPLKRIVVKYSKTESQKLSEEGYLWASSLQYNSFLLLCTIYFS